MNVARMEKEMLVSRLLSLRQETLPGTKTKKFAVLKVKAFANGSYEVIKSKQLLNMLRFLTTFALLSFLQTTAVNNPT